MPSPNLPNSDDDRFVGDSLAEGSEEDEEVEYEEIEIEEEVEIEEEEEGEEEVEIEEEVEMEEDEEEEMEVEEVEHVEEEKEIQQERSDLPIDIERKGHQSTRLEVNLIPESVNIDIATISAPTDDLERGGLVSNSKASCSNQIRLNEDPFDNSMGECSNMKQHLAIQGNILQSLAGENKNSEDIQEREASRDDSEKDGVQSSFYGRENMVAKAFEPLPFPVGVLDSAIFRNEGLLKESNPMGLGAKVQATSTQSGLHVREIRPRSLSPTIELKDGNKRPSLICDFFALGWCIKGSSCRFRHVKDHKDAVESSMDKKELQSNANEDTGDGLGRSGSSEFSNAAIPSVAHGSFTLEKVPSLEHGGSTKQHQFSERALSLQREDSSTLKDMTGFVPLNASRSMMPNFHRMSTLTPSGFAFNPPELYLPPREYRSTINNIALYDWEPSMPFQPSFTFTRSLLKGSLHDPIHDCIEEPTLSGTSYRLDVTTSNSLHNRDVDNIFSDNVGQQSGRNITSKHHSFSNNNISDRNSGGRELFLNEKEDSSSSHAGPQSRVPLVKDEKTSGISMKDKRGDMTSKVDTIRPITEVMVSDETMNDQPESKMQKYFRAKLIDFIKELVKPTWREGRLTKTAHKVIVKRAVEKVLSEENEFPSTEDSIHQYLSVSQPKLSKLVAGYIIKYGKS